MREYNSCFSYIGTILIAIETWKLLLCLVCAGLMTPPASVKFPGEIYPKSLSILIGSDATITCRLFKPNSSDIWFIEEKTKKAIKQPSELIKKIDQYTAVLIINNAEEQSSRYQCKVGDYGIGESELYVGTKPLDIKDFSCISYDYEYMDCSFTRPKNMIFTRFDLEYVLPKDGYVYKCYCHDFQNRKLKCNVNDYLPMRDTYIFILKGSNDVGENIQKFSINNHKNVIPSSVHIVKQNITSSSITLSMEKLKISYYIKSGLTYDIQIRDTNSNWRTPHMGDLDCQTSSCNILVSHLYAYWLYWIKIRVKSNVVENDHFWSNESMISFRTKSEKPKRAPETPLGSFYIDSTETQLRLYWEQMAEYEQNGPNFHYVINEINVYGEVMFSTKTNESTLTFTLKNESTQIFTIKSVNDIGESLEKNIIQVYRCNCSTNELKENSIAKVYQNRSYTLSWLPPDNITDLINYTIFWCLPKVELPNQCKGPIFFKYLDKFATNFTTDPKDRSLNLAISANYPHYNKGMQWARCSDDISTELMKMEFETSALNQSAIMVKWSSGSVCASILKGYNLTYCHASIEDKCVTSAVSIELLREKQEYRNYTISNIPPYTNVCFYMFMYSWSKQGRISDLQCVRTKASAPSPPKNIKYIAGSLTSKSAEIQWSPPSMKNGVLSHYSIYWRKYPDHTFEVNMTTMDQTVYKLTGLKSFSNYEVYITAHTIKESVPSKRIKFKTLIGIPTGPRNLNIFENDTVIYWDQPDLPSGRHLFYIVALIRRDYNFNAIYERVSIVEGRSCRFQQPDCSNSNKSYALKIRAVNVGGMDEVDREIVSMKKETILSGAPIDEKFCKPDKADNSFGVSAKRNFQNYKNRFYFASPWVVAPRSYSCSTSSKGTIYAVALLIVVAFVAYICCWLRNKYYKMKNIKVILPEGLVEQVSNYKFDSKSLNNKSDLGSSTKKKFQSHTSQNFDCLLSYDSKENLNIITNVHRGLTNALPSCSSFQEKNHEEHISEHASLETTNEQLSSKSCSVSNSIVTYHDDLQITPVSSFDRTIRDYACEENGNDIGDSKEHIRNLKTIQHLDARQRKAYMTHNIHMLSSILNDDEINVKPTHYFNNQFSTMGQGGYVQSSSNWQLSYFSNHEHQTIASLSGYTWISSLSKNENLVEFQHETAHTSSFPTVSDIITLNTTPISSCNTFRSIQPSTILSSLQTSTVVTDVEKYPRTECYKDYIQPTGRVDSPNNASQQQNNTINGYVTQRQLATFSNNVASEKVLKH